MAKKNKRSFICVAHAIILAIIGEGKDYGSSIGEVYKQKTGRDIVRSTIYITLDRMMEVGLLTRHETRKSPEGGGNHLVFYEATELGKRKLEELRAAIESRESMPFNTD